MEGDIKTGDSEAMAVVHPIILVLDNLRSAYNVGNIFRLAEVCRLEKIVTCGYTATPPHPKLQKTARGCDRIVPFEHYETASDAILELKAAGYFTVAVETVRNAAHIWDADLRFPVAFVFGNEALGIAESTLEYCDSVACLPVFGSKNSLNVSNCAAAIVYSSIQRTYTTRDLSA